MQYFIIDIILIFILLFVILLNIRARVMRNKSINKCDLECVYPLNKVEMKIFNSLCEGIGLSSDLVNPDNRLEQIEKFYPFSDELYDLLEDYLLAQSIKPEDIRITMIGKSTTLLSVTQFIYKHKIGNAEQVSIC